MEQILHSEIFFFITSIFVVILTIVLSIASFYIIRILSDFSEISDKLKKTVNDATAELSDLVEQIEDSPVFKLLFWKRKKAKKDSRK